MGNAVIVTIFEEPKTAEDFAQVIERAQKAYNGYPGVQIKLMNGDAAKTVEFFVQNGELPVDEALDGGVKDDILPDLGDGGLYRKKPVKVRAERLCKRNVGKILDFMDIPVEDRYETNIFHEILLEDVSDPCGEETPYIALRVTTVHGDEAIIRHGDWILPDSAPGTFYPCKPDVFEQTYERIG